MPKWIAAFANDFGSNSFDFEAQETHFIVAAVLIKMEVIGNVISLVVSSTLQLATYNNEENLFISKCILSNGGKRKIPGTKERRTFCLKKRRLNYRLPPSIHKLLSKLSLVVPPSGFSNTLKETYDSFQYSSFSKSYLLIIRNNFWGSQR